MAAYAALLSVMNIIDNLQLHPRPPISLPPTQVESLTKNIKFPQEFLEGYNPHLGYTTEADPLESRIAAAAYAAEDVIESHIVDRIITGDGEKTTSLYEDVEKVFDEMSLIEKEAMEIKQTPRHQLLHAKSTPPDGLSSSIEQKKRMVGADDVLLEMKDKLTSDCRDLRIVPVVGMGGSGKTTLAMSTYQDRLVKEHFHVCAWATISQDFSIREMLVEVLRQLDQYAGENLSEGELGEVLYKHFFGRKYLIVLDDMWSVEAWDGVRRFLPDNKNGSRIVVTTRLSNLASNLPNSNRIEMNLLDEAHSWDLFSSIVFGEEGCPLEMEKIGKKIVRTCKGLPLSIVVIGGFLAKSKRTSEFWESIEENLNSIVNLEGDECCLKILHMSYRQLPVYLKPCFLYMGLFPEDQVIRASRLVKLWVSEGLLKPASGKTLEEIAREYLKDLADRNLILIDELGITGNIKHCKIHDLLRDLCLREARKERFCSVVTRLATPEGMVNAQRRIAISKNEDINDSLSMSVVRSLMWNLELGQVPPPLSFRLLRVLASCRYPLPEFQENMFELVNSRFLAFSAPSPVLEFPLPIGVFWNLQTLIVNGFYTYTAPADIWSMPHIRHVQFRTGLYLPDPPNGHDEVVLGNLQTLERIENFSCSERVVKRIPNIQKLGIYYDYDENLDDDRYCLSNLEFLDKLEICTFRQRMSPREAGSIESLINFPHSLKKLTIEIYQSECWDDILDKIGSLPLLQKLKLLEGSFGEGQWETSKGQFRSLKFLTLESCQDLRVWTTESSHFPCLEQLGLSRLDDLEEIPFDLADISTLGAIKVKFCCESVVVSAKRVLEEHEELYGEAALRVRVRLCGKHEAALESLASPNFRVAY
ncbi:putative late blight resistance protein R1A-3 isoform X2 [Salvia divinorum]|uniref:Late blight resistance protein R1A-3 isoform X2 n=1 Tax=Salvia divinorum TaxID=28513 RepID=A0ABD1G4K6_SALDI